MKSEPEFDFLNIWKRVRRSGLQNELLIRAAKPERQRAAKGAEAGAGLTAIDATAGFGEDAFLLAAAGYDVTMYERNPAVAAVLREALSRAAAQDAEEPAGSVKFDGTESSLADVVARMHLIDGDSAAAMRTMAASQGPAARIDVIYLDPMFPQDNKSALSKKKLQFIKEQQEKIRREPKQQTAAQMSIPVVDPTDASPTTGGVLPDGLTATVDEEALLAAALALRPRKVIIKRPLKGPFLGGVTPGYSIKGKLIRYDCIVL